ncbi:MAG: hypothetical protein IJT88_05040 [Kiritimatiellae bacterium]|nr:hypothetical protein [Kiritimatiellia bacterium]
MMSLCRQSLALALALLLVLAFSSAGAPPAAAPTLSVTQILSPEFGGSAPVPAHPADATPPAALDALRAATHASARWTLYKTIPSLPRPLVSTGRVDCHIGDAITWTTLTPFPSAIVMRPDAMLFIQDGVTNTIPARDLPHYAHVVAATEALASGDLDRLAREFAIAPAPLPPDVPGATWDATFTPRRSQLAAFLTAIDLAGADALLSAHLYYADGTSMRLRFTPETDAPMPAPAP